MENLEALKDDSLFLARLLTQEEVANMLHISPKTLECWRWKNIGPRYVKVGRLARYREADILAFILSLVEGGGSLDTINCQRGNC
ncbi:hypothetical protein GMST_42590 [Geomonas silvestris]|uniref:Helix-turn-helix domain-containing protein n=1 Tax=Geomonas silvestris TaxID=2740184 RepID=A0A6V8MPT2_9BACT|nr:helix-turn-helix domain-containing protein [Geomonas silvestris]GFO61934.1 hypothetical protein GMST_42590 [Geomonas silvestris]